MKLKLLIVRKTKQSHQMPCISSIFLATVRQPPVVVSFVTFGDGFAKPCLRGEGSSSSAGTSAKGVAGTGVEGSMSSGLEWLWFVFFGPKNDDLVSMGGDLMVIFMGI